MKTDISGPGAARGSLNRLSIVGFEFQAATECLLSRKHRGTKAENGIDPSAAQQTLEEYVLSVPDDDITMWTDPSASPLPASVLKTSVKWSEGYKLKNWARRVNVENGTPIRSELMASHFNESLASNELSGFGKEVHSSSAFINIWCHRWRLRHGAKYGFLRTSEHIALEDQREQALTGVSTSPPSPPDAFTVPEHPGLVLYPSGGPYHQYTVLSSILKQWWIWLPKGSNLEGFGPPFPPLPGRRFDPPKRTQKSVQNYGAKLDRSSGKTWPSGSVFSEKKMDAARSVFWNIDFHFCENPYSKLTKMGGGRKGHFWGSKLA